MLIPRVGLAALLTLLAVVAEVRFAAAEDVDAADAPAAGSSAKPVFKPADFSAVFVEQFSADSLATRWHVSEATKSQGDESFRYEGEWRVEEPHTFAALDGDYGLVMKSSAKHHAISASLPEVLDNTGKTLVLQYEVKMQNELTCGGAYIKLLTSSPDGVKYKAFDDKTPYTIMFGPDRCGATNKVHFIFRHKNPKTGDVEEKHFLDAPIARVTKLSTLYTLIVKPDNSVEMRVNGETMSTGNLLTSFSPAVNPSKEVEDEDDVEPADWVHDAKIADPTEKKPEDWDEDAPYEIPDESATRPADWLESEPEMIADPDAEKPEEWDNAEDGEWIAPQISNPKCDSISGCGPWRRPNKRNPAYKGKWHASLVDNPAYKGEWKPRMIPNPDYVEDSTPSNFQPISAIGFELWTIESDILFDNIYLGHSVADAEAFANATWTVKHTLEEELEMGEKKDEAEDDNLDNLDGPSFLQRLRMELDAFVNMAVEDPIEALFAYPRAAGTLIAGTITIVLAFFSLLGLLGSGTDDEEEDSEKEKRRQEKRRDGKLSDDESAGAADAEATQEDESEAGGAKKRASKKKNKKKASTGSGEQ